MDIDLIIKSLLKTSFMGRTIKYCKCVNSTNTLAKENLSCPDGTIFIADMQTDGKGRMGRKWKSEEKSQILMSVLLKPDILPEQIPQITLVAGLAVCKALSAYNVEIKWPNDIIHGTKKVCGILTENVIDKNKSFNIICGIGINVNNTGFDNELFDKATSLYIIGNKKLSREEIIADILNIFEKLYIEFLNNGFESLLNEYASLCINIGKTVNVVYKNETVTGTVKEITKDGALIIRANDKDITVSSGEVSIRGIYGYV